MSRPLTVPTRLWRIAGALALGHLVLMFSGFAFDPAVVLGEGRSADAAGLVHRGRSSGRVRPSRPTAPRRRCGREE
jgi:hypothetical protein